MPCRPEMKGGTGTKHPTANNDDLRLARNHTLPLRCHVSRRPQVVLEMREYPETSESPMIPEAVVLVMGREELPSQARVAYYSLPASSTSAGESHRTPGIAQTS